MPRLRNVRSGAVVSVPDEKAARMDTEWEPLEEQSKAQSRPAAKRAAKKDEK